MIGGLLSVFGFWAAILTVARKAKRFAADAAEQAYEDEVAGRQHGRDRVYRWPHERGQKQGVDE